ELARARIDDAAAETVRAVRARFSCRFRGALGLGPDGRRGHAAAVPGFGARGLVDLRERGDLAADDRPPGRALERQVIVAGEGHEACIRNSRRESSAQLERDRGIPDRMKDERRRLDLREPLRYVERLNGAIELRGERRARRAPLQLVELVPLRFGRIRNEQRREDLAERRIALTPAELDQLTERFSLRLRDERSARERAGQDQLADPLGMANGILDRDRAALRHADEVGALYPQGVC